MSAQQISTSVTIISSLLGFQGLSLTNFTTSALSAISQGSKLEVAGAFFNWAGDETPNASSWTAIATAATAYLQCTPSGSAGTQILTASWTTTAPTFSVTKQGWYASAASAVRVVASVYKTSATQQNRKRMLVDRNDLTDLLFVSVELGDWNMDSTNSITVTHGLDASKIRGWYIVIREDADEAGPDIGGMNQAEENALYVPAFSTVGATLNIYRVVSGAYDNTRYDSTSYNRGWITFAYIP